MEGWEIIQKCELASSTGLFGKRKFIAFINELTPDQFNRFCKEYLHLRHFYASNLNAWATDEQEPVQYFPDLFWKLRAIDFDSPLNFVKVP